MDQTKSQLQAVIETAATAIITISNSGTILSANPATTKMFGYTNEELLGRNVSMLAPQPHRSQHDGYLKRYLDTGEKRIIGKGRELDAIRKNGSTLPIHLAISEFHHNNQIHFVGIISDLTDTRAAERELKAAMQQVAYRSEVQKKQIELYQLLGEDDPFEQKASKIIEFICAYTEAPVGIIYLVSSDGACASFLSGYRAPARSESTSFKIDEGLVGQVLRRRQLQTCILDQPHHLNLHTGITLVQLNRLLAFPLRAGGDLVAVVELGLQQSLLSEKEEFLELIGEAVALNLLLRLKDQRLKELLSETQIQATDLQAQQEELRATNEQLQASEQELKAQQEKLRAANDELSLRTQALESEKTLLREKTHQLEQTQGMLESRAREVEEASRYKSEFLANMSHELRTPLNSILMLSQSLSENRQGNLLDKQTSHLETIYSAGNDLLALINDVLDLSKIEAGKIELAPQEFSLRDLLLRIERSMRPMATSKGLDFELKSSPHLPNTLFTDRRRLEQILRNLLSNAIKFTEKGHIILEADTTDSGDCRLVVKDTGIGIMEDQLPQIFQAFHQVDGKTTRKFGGTGLGLSITKQLVSLIGGSLQAASIPGEGSAFTFVLPCKLPQTRKFNPLPQPAQPPQPQPATPSVKLKDDRHELHLGDKVLLIIEDDADFSRILMNLCRERGFKVVSCQDGHSGVRLAEEIRPLGILLDLTLPQIEGLQVIDLLKSNPLTQHIPIQVVSGSDGRRESLNRGALGYLEKPIRGQDLKEAISDMEKLAPRSLRHLLLIEDNHQHREAIRELLGEHDLQVEEASSGSEALQALNKHMPHCIILDKGLPDMDGTEFLRLAQAAHGDQLAPVIVYTGRELADSDLNILEHSSQSIIIKSTESNERLLYEATLFLHRVEKNLSRQQRRTLHNLRDPGRILRDRQVLIVDDDSRNRVTLTEVLEDTGMTMTTVTNGKEAVELIQRQTQLFDIVLMDMMMPVMDGYEATSAIKQLRQDLPVIALTARAMMGEKEKCLAAGCDDYITKPINTDQLLSLMRVWLYNETGGN